MSGRVLVVGAGDVGTLAALIVAAGGREVIATRRTPQPLPAPLVSLAFDVTEPASFEALPADIAWLVYSVAAPERTQADYEAVFLRGLEALLSHLARTSPELERIVFTSSTAVYGDHRGAWIDESATHTPVEWNGTVLREAEQLLGALTIPSTSVRLGGIYGPSRGELLESVRTGRASRPIDRAPVNRIHRDDAARAIAHLLTLEAPPRAVNVVDDLPAPRCDVLAHVAEALGRDPHAYAPTSGDDARGKRCRNELLKSTGFSLRFPTFREGYAAALAAADARR